MTGTACVLSGTAPLHATRGVAATDMKSGRIMTDMETVKVISAMIEVVAANGNNCRAMCGCFGRAGRTTWT